MADSSQSKRGASIMASTVMATVKKHMARITKAAEHNLELQTVLLSAIDDYNKDGQGSLTEMVAQKKKRKSGSGLQALGERIVASAARDDPEDLVKDENETLDRNKSHWGKWSIKLLRNMLYYCSPKHMTQQWLEQFKDKAALLNVLEFAFDVRAMGEAPDKPATLNKAALFKRMRTLYLKLGSRMDSLVGYAEGGFINWKENGVYSVVITDDPDPLKVRVEVYSRFLNCTAVLKSDVTQGDLSLKTAQIVQNYSQSTAYLQTTTDTYLIQNLFPQLGRSLRRRVSDSIGVTSEVASAAPLGGAPLPQPAAPSGGSSGQAKAGPPRRQQLAPPASAPAKRKASDAEEEEEDDEGEAEDGEE